MPEETEWSPRPKSTNGVPFCTYEDCPEYDGKRCKMMGFRPSQICEPAVQQMSFDLEATTARAEKAGDALAKIASGMAWPLNNDLPQRILEAVRLATADAVRWGARAQEAEELLRDREKDLGFEHARAEVFEKACDGIATALGWPIPPHPEDVDRLVEAVVWLVSHAQQLVSRLEQAEGKRNCDVCVWDGLDCNDRKPEGCERWLCVPPGCVPKPDLDEAIERAKKAEEEVAKLFGINRTLAEESKFADIAAMVVKDAKAKNYVEMQLVAGDGAEYVMTFQRRDGETPHQLRVKAEAEVAGLLSMLREWWGSSKLSCGDGTYLAWYDSFSQRVKALLPETKPIGGEG